MRVYAIGDIHGQLSKLVDVHRQIERDRERTSDAEALVVHLGDLVDRGPDSRGVIDYLIEGIGKGEPWRVIKGNHDRMFADYVRTARDDPRLSTGLTYMHENIGGRETLGSYGVVGGMFEKKDALARRASEAVPEEHLSFIENLPLFHLTDELLMVHAGVRPGVALGDQEEEDLLWIRQEFLTDQTDHGHLVVHGHTPVKAPEHHGNRVALDTGAGFGGPLTAAVFEGREAFVLTDSERLPLSPFEPV